VCLTSRAPLPVLRPRSSYRYQGRQGTAPRTVSEAAIKLPTRFGLQRLVSDGGSFDAVQLRLCTPCSVKRRKTRRRDNRPDTMVRPRKFLFSHPTIRRRSIGCHHMVTLWQGRIMTRQCAISEGCVLGESASPCFPDSLSTLTGLSCFSLSARIAMPLSVRCVMATTGHPTPG